ncbi:MAG: radical SAM protein [Deltaproteobacteria bacterium]|nr:radical SAM protein [Deltaproteobacteria bacterium]
MLFSTDDGQLLEHPHLRMAAHNGQDFVVPAVEEMTALPPKWEIMQLPDTFPVGFDPVTGSFEVVDSVPGLRGVRPRAAAIHPPPGHVRQYLPAADYLPFTAPETAPLRIVDEGGMPGRSGLPLWAYTAVGWARGSVMAAMFQGDELSRWHPSLFYKDELPTRVDARLREDPDNPVLLQLRECAVDYKCCCAQNIFYGRWEGAIPMAPACNAACLGCLSKDAEWDAPTPQKRLKFSPQGEEIGRVIAFHLKHAPEGMCSFGQGCEGEPTLSSDALVDSVAFARRTQTRGIIHLNTNGSRPEVVGRAAAAGINSIRVSVNSFDEPVFEAYYRPRDYKLADLYETLRVARDAGLYKCINLLLWPGWTDTRSELERVSRLVSDGLLEMIQLRNLCVDPAYYEKILPKQRERPMGLRTFVEELHRRHPALRFGTFNPRLAAEWFKETPPWVADAR